MSLDSYRNYLRHEKRYSEHTITAYLRDINQFQQFIELTYGQTADTAVQRTHARSWVVQLVNDGIEARSVNRKISSLKNFYRFLLRGGKISANPFSTVHSLKTPTELPKFIEEAQMQLLFAREEFGEDYPGLRDRSVLELLYGTGMRRAELIRMKETDIDIDNSCVRILGKGKKERFVPVHPELPALLKHLAAEGRRLFGPSEEGLLFRTDSGRPVYPKLVYRIVKKYLSSVTTSDQKSPHVLRHSYATHLLNRGADLNAIKELLGHANLGATQVYTHNSIEKLKEAYKSAHPKS